jgi:beta-xylosidase
MKNQTKNLLCLTVLLISTSSNIFSQSIDVLGGLPQLANFQCLGIIQPRNSKEIRSSNWSVGAEMMDRDFTLYKNWKNYLGKLGVKKARIQSGWARCEKIKGIYDWAWLDEIIYDMVAQGVEPWISLSYGNPVYTGGGGTTLNAAVPKSAEAIEGWSKFVKAILQRYGDFVDEWEVWNEPNYKIEASDYANLLITTAEIIRADRPKATVIAFAIGSGVDYKYVDKVMAIVQQKGKVNLIDQVTHHRHIPVPENRDSEIELEKVVRKYSDKIKIRQGEAGCPSGWSSNFALKEFNWSEITQAKHILRRLLTDLGNDKESSCFTIMDAKYPQEWNLKGLLKANQQDSTVAYPKPAYYAVQHLTSIFDDQLVRLKDYHSTLEKADSIDLAVYAYSGKTNKNQLVSVWKKGRRPSDSTIVSLCGFAFSRGSFKTPVLVDLVSGKVYQIPDNNWKKKGKQYSFNNIPVPDYPVLIADKSLVKIISE